MKNPFNLSHTSLLTGNMGYLIPLTWYETLPNDKMWANCRLYMRISPLATPVMHDVSVRVHNFFVPNRLIWEDWEDFITGGPDGDDTSVAPTITFASVAEGSLADYLDCPVSTTSRAVSALPFRALAFIWNTFYRDQHIMDELVFSTASGADTTTNTSLQRICWEKDPFTTARPEPQLGDSVTIPLGSGYGDVQGDGSAPTFTNDGGTTTSAMYPGGGSSPYNEVKLQTGMPGYVNDLNWDDPHLQVDMSSLSGMDLIDLREAIGTQRFRENMMRYGATYKDYCQRFGARFPDGRLDEPEYLGGGRSTINFTEVLSTDGANTGEMAGHGQAFLRQGRWSKYFPEHGIVMSLLSVRPKTIYSQGLPKKLQRTTKEEYFQRELEFIGEQEIANSEIYADHASPTGIFGYRPRYDSWRAFPSKVSGEFNTTLHDWHMAREFSSDPSLNTSFIQATPTNRIYQSTATDQLLVYSTHSIKSRRMLSRHAMPRIL
jgi:hypothetical protein